MNSIVIFGAGKLGIKYKNYLKDFIGTVDNIYFYDSSPSKQGYIIDGIKCYTKDEFLSTDKSSTTVVICNASKKATVNEMLEDTLVAGYQENQIYITYYLYNALTIEEYRGLPKFDALDLYANEYPSDQVGANIFRGEWTSTFPKAGITTGGRADVFADPRLSWFLSEFGSLVGKKVLELGYLEGFHTYMLEQAGAESILGIDANTRSYLKSLVTKEVMGMKKAKFLCGDFMRYLEECGDTNYDIIVASGVLYHMENPVKLLYNLSRHSDVVYIWTQYYDINEINKIYGKENFQTADIIEYGGFKCTAHKNEYGIARESPGYMAGMKPFSYWLEKKDIIDCLKFFGFNEIKTNIDAVGPNGPSICILGKRL